MRPERWKPWAATQHPDLRDVLLIPIHGWVNRKRAVVAHVLIDAADLPLVQGCYWQLHGGRNNYARGKINGRSTGMHRIILGITDPKTQVDHINHDTLDNRRENLRIATPQQNSFNQRSKGISGFKGVGFCRRTGRWQAQITHNYKCHFLGRHATPEEAARVYDAEARKLFGEYAHLNFPEGR